MQKINHIPINFNRKFGCLFEIYIILLVWRTRANIFFSNTPNLPWGYNLGTYSHKLKLRAKIIEIRDKFIYFKFLFRNGYFGIFITNKAAK